MTEEKLPPKQDKYLAPVDEAFTVWLEEEHPSHSIYDHESLGAYRRWQRELQQAFRGGWKAARNPPNPER